MASVVSTPMFAKPFNSEAVLEHLLDVLIDTAEDIQSDYKETTKTWDTQVIFEVDVFLDNNEFAVIVGSDNQVYEWVNEGTKEHVILPRPDNPTGRLHYQAEFEPKTRPGFIGSQRGGKYGEWVYEEMTLPTGRVVRVPGRSGVLHPGIAPRFFDEAITQRWQSRLDRRLENGLTEVLRAEGWL